MTAGVKTYDSSNDTVEKREFRLPEQKIYRAKLNADAVGIQEMDGGRSFVKGVKFELLDSAAVPGGRNLTISVAYFLDTTPNEQGKVAIKAPDGILGLARGFGEQLKGIPVIDTDSGEQLDSRVVKQWLKDHNGRLFDFKARHKKDKDDPDKKFGAVDFYVEKEPEPVVNVVE